MKVGVPKESFPQERRVAATPASVKALRKLGFDVVLERGAGLAAGFDDAAYEEAGAVVGEAAAAWSCGIVAKVRAPSDDELPRLGANQTLISYLHPAQHPDLIDALRARRANVVAMDQVPRTTRAQKLDALSSMGNLAGYRAVVEATAALQRPLGGQSTAAGKVPPAKVLVIGAGVAGLAAIGAARALGAIVRAFDTRPAVREQVASMGAEFLEIRIDEDGSGVGGYAKEMSPAFLAAERALFLAQAKDVDVIITTALIPGRRAPTLIEPDMVAAMRRGSVVVDLAAEQGGNCALTRPGEAVDVNGVTVIGYTDLVSRMARQASTLYATNIVNLLDEAGGAAAFTLDAGNDVVGPMIVVRDGEVVWRPPAPPPPPAPGGEAPKPAAAPAAQTVHGSQHGPPVRETPSKKPWLLLGAAGLALFGVGLGAPPDFLTHFTVFVLACFIGYQVIWSVTPALHTPLMSVTNAISGIIILGGLLQIAGGVGSAAEMLGLVAIFVAMINISGGFLVTQRMLKMFRK